MAFRRKTIVATALVVVLGLLAWPLAKAHLQAIAVLDTVSGKPVPTLIAELVEGPIQVVESDFQTASGTVRARLYLPVSKPDAPGLVVLHGVHYLGIDEPRMEGFARAMASCGIRVLTPELPGIKDYQIGAGSIRTIGESAAWFAKQTGAPVGVLGLSFSGGLALVAAGDPAYKADFKFVLAVGSQDSLGRVADYFRTGLDARPDGSVEALAPHEYGPLVLEYEHVEDFVPAEDVVPIRAVLRAHLYEDGPGEKLAMAALDPRQLDEARNLMNAGADGTKALLAASTARHLVEMSALSPRGRLSAMTTPVYLLHGQGDNIIPAAETLWMASELPAKTLKASLVSPVISHVNFDGPSPGARDQWRLLHFFALVMRAAGTQA